MTLAAYRILLILFAQLFWVPISVAQFNFDSLFASSSKLKHVAHQKDKYHLQIIYSRVLDSSDKKILKHFRYNTRPDNYLYCASLIKLPVAVLCLKKFNDLGLDFNSIILTDSSRACHRKVHHDSTTQNGRPNLAQYIRKMMLVSDNEAYNRCFEFLGVDYIHEELGRWLYPNVRIINRYELNCPPGNNVYTNPVRICDSNLNVLYSQAEEPISEEWRRPVYKVKLGRAYKDFNDKMIYQSKDFSFMNYMSLEDCHRFLLELLESKGAKFGLSLPQFELLEHCMSQWPAQSVSPKYNREDFPDTFKKYLFFEEGQDLPNDSNFVSTNVVGLSYGFISDCMRFTDRKSGITFYLSAGLYVNSDEVLNDGKYEYHSIGRPFLTELGKQIHKFELLQNAPK